MSNKFWENIVFVVKPIDTLFCCPLWNLDFIASASVFPYMLRLEIPWNLFWVILPQSEKIYNILLLSKKRTDYKDTKNKSFFLVICEKCDMRRSDNFPGEDTSQYKEKLPRRRPMNYSWFLNVKEKLPWRRPMNYSWFLTVKEKKMLKKVYRPMKLHLIVEKN